MWITFHLWNTISLPVHTWIMKHITDSAVQAGLFARVRSRIFEDRDLQVRTKLLVYKAIILPTPLYVAENWTTCSRHLEALECFWKMLRINWKDRHTHISVPEEANIDSITTNIIKQHLRWNGQVVRMPDFCLPKQIL